MNDESNDIHIDEQFYIARSPEDNMWRLFDCGEETHKEPSLPQMRSFVHGLWRGMAILGEVELVCTVYAQDGTVLDQMVSKDMLQCPT